jgi:cyclohexyl-isocyanide hydratase
MSTTIVIPLYEGVNLLDVAGPLEMFFWVDFGQQFQAVLASDGGRQVTSINGVTFGGATPASFADWMGDDPRPIDVLWVPGGNPDDLVKIMSDDKHPYLEFLRTVAPRAEWVCSVCEGALLMARVGLLDGYEATTHWQFINCLKQFKKVKVLDQLPLPRFHVDRNRLTGGGISSGLDEALKLIELLQGEAAAGRVQQTTQYFPRPPVDNPITAIPACGRVYPQGSETAAAAE